MKPSLYDRVALCRDRDDLGLKRGDVATLVDVIPHPSGGEEGAILEVFNTLGESIAVVIVKVSEIETLRADDTPSTEARGKITPPA
ncbi:DUF4926 domain-containing protein [Tautonia rosea]|uniref:DUF4926 domain-containing protein n=1 Tax=Tautonia rosea TaxID=2728037 RepID=UPI0014765517|nr:DUF4926 domain-containing protein [Tautonia rosea]